jgi:hypothetical protein
MSIRTDKLLITSDFYSIQGEGISSGIPSYFVRLGVCNLSCGMSRKWFNELVKMNKDLPEEKKHELEIRIEGQEKLMKEMKHSNEKLAKDNKKMNEQMKE